MSVKCPAKHERHTDLDNIFLPVFKCVSDAVSSIYTTAPEEGLQCQLSQKRETRHLSGNVSLCVRACVCVCVCVCEMETQDIVYSLTGRKPLSVRKAVIVNRAKINRGTSHRKCLWVYVCMYSMYANTIVHCVRRHVCVERGRDVRC